MSREKKMLLIIIHLVSNKLFLFSSLSVSFDSSPIMRLAMVLAQHPGFRPTMAYYLRMYIVSRVNPKSEHLKLKSRRICKKKLYIFH
jgi:hypothetical protein